MNLNRVNMHDNADYGRNYCGEVLFKVIVTPRRKTVASQHGIAYYQPSFTIRSCNTDGVQQLDV